TLAVKLTRPLPAVPPRVLTYTEGNFGAPGGGLARDVPQRVLVGAQWVVVVAGVVMLVIAGPRGRRMPRTVRGWVVTALVVGGAKLSWRVLGTVWARNLTPDRDTGLGAWTDGEIARAMRSGIAKDGRPLHWQAMIWDHASNWDEEDVQALIAFLRALPPLHRAIPTQRPPAADDCEVYTFWVDRSTTPGCRRRGQGTA